MSSLEQKAQATDLNMFILQNILPTDAQDRSFFVILNSLIFKTNSHSILFSGKYKANETISKIQFKKPLKARMKFLNYLNFDFELQFHSLSISSSRSSFSHNLPEINKIVRSISKFYKARHSKQLGI